MSDRAPDGGELATDGGEAAESDTAHEFTVRRARESDVDPVVAFTEDTWGDRRGDYMPRVFGDWVEGDGPDRRTFVVDVDGGDDVAGVMQCVLLSDAEAWAQGLRVAPDYRGRGLTYDLSRAAFGWARERGAVVCRNMVFSWNAAGLGLSRGVGYDPGAEFRWLRPEPDAGAGGEGGDRARDDGVEIRADPDAAWAYWTACDAREELSGLAMDAGESWACSELTREDLRRAADRDGLFVAADGGTRGFTALAYTYDRTGEDGAEESWGVYHVAAWDDPAALGALADAVARDAADRGLDATRVLIPEGVRWVSDAAAERVPASDEPDFLLAADLTDGSLY